MLHIQRKDNFCVLEEKELAEISHILRLNAQTNIINENKILILEKYECKKNS
jgi:hypothetical protein